MGHPVVLPKLEVPREKLHWSFRMLWLAGGLLGLSMLVLGGAMYRVHATRQEAEQAKADRIAGEKAEAEAKVQAALLAAAKAAEVKNLAEAKAAEAAAAKNLALANTVTSMATLGGIPEDVLKRSGHHHHHHSHLKTHKPGTRLASVSPSKEGSSSKGSSTKRNDAAIDDLLSKMK
jgi:hypothetical protein